MFGVVEALGVRVVEVDVLRDEACYVADQGVALVRSGLTQASLDDVVDWLIWQVLDIGSTA